MGPFGSTGGPEEARYQAKVCGNHDLKLSQANWQQLGPNLVPRGPPGPYGAPNRAFWGQKGPFGGPWSAVEVS